MLTKHGVPKCDECGRFVSWIDIMKGKARYATGVIGDSYGNPIEYYDCVCSKCVKIKVMESRNGK